MLSMSSNFATTTNTGEISVSNGPSFSLMTVTPSDMNAFHGMASPEKPGQQASSDVDENGRLYLELEQDEAVRLDVNAETNTGDSFIFPLFGVKLRGLVEGRQLVFVPVSDAPGYVFKGQLVLENTSRHAVAFKVVGNRSSLFRAEPNQGVVHPGQALSFKILLKDKRTILSSNEMPNRGAGDFQIDKAKTMQPKNLELSGLKVRVKLAHLEPDDTMGTVWSRKDAIFDVSPRFDCKIWEVQEPLNDVDKEVDQVPFGSGFQEACVQVSLEDLRLNEFELVDEGADVEDDEQDVQEEEEEYEWVEDDEEVVEEEPAELFFAPDELNDQKPPKRSKFLSAIKVVSKGLNPKRWFHHKKAVKAV